MPYHKLRWDGQVLAAILNGDKPIYEIPTNGEELVISIEQCLVRLCQECWLSPSDQRATATGVLCKLDAARNKQEDRTILGIKSRQILARPRQAVAQLVYPIDPTEFNIMLPQYYLTMNKQVDHSILSRHGRSINLHDLHSLVAKLGGGSLVCFFPAF